MEEALKDFYHHFPQIVAWGEMDAFGHVNNIVYFRYFESARIAFLKAIDWWQDESHLEQHTGSGTNSEARIGPIISQISARYRRAVYFPDHLIIGSRAEQIESDRFILEHAIYSQSQKTLVTFGISTVVAYDYRIRKKALLPPTALAGIQKLQGS